MYRIRRAWLRYLIWYCRVVCQRTPRHWVRFGSGRMRHGYYLLRQNGRKGSFIADDGQIFI